MQKVYLQHKQKQLIIHQSSFFFNFKDYDNFLIMFYFLPLTCN